MSKEMIVLFAVAIIIAYGPWSQYNLRKHLTYLVCKQVLTIYWDHVNA